MTGAPVIAAEDVRAALRARDVLEFYGWQVRRAGDELESCACPERNDHARRAFVINANSGRWQCFPCATSGDLFDFVAAVERLQMPIDFPTVLAKCAEIAGVGPSSLSEIERRQRREEWKRRQRELDERAARERLERDLAAVPIATTYWEHLLTAHQRGLAYLHERAVEEVMRLTDAVRFDPKHAGSPALALYSSAGEIRNVVARRVPELGEPKTPGLYQCPSAGTLINAVSQIEHTRDVVLVEGVFDAITARLAWPGSIVLGAHGAGNLTKIAQVAIPSIVRTHTRLRVVPHRDRRGYETAAEVTKLALDAGLSFRRGTLEVMRLPSKDLNDAWRHGWRPAA